MLSGSCSLSDSEGSNGIEYSADSDYTFESMRNGRISQLLSNSGQGSVQANDYACYSSAQKVKKAATCSTDKVASQFKKLKRTLRRSRSAGEDSDKCDSSVGGTAASPGDGESRQSPQHPVSSDALNAFALSANVTSTQTAQLCVSRPSLNEENPEDDGTSCSTSSARESKRVGASSRMELLATATQEYACTQPDESLPCQQFRSPDSAQEPDESSAKEKSHIYISMSELFEKPNVNLLSRIPDSAPCLHPSQEIKKHSHGENQSRKPQTDKSEICIEKSVDKRMLEGETSSEGNGSCFHYSDPYFPSLMQDSLRELALDGHFTDVTLEIDEHRFLCHRMILAASSKYFRAMFCNNYREKHQSSVAIRGVSADIMKILIRYAYTSSLEVKRDDVQKVLEAASLLQFDRVMEACSNYFIAELSVENAPGIMELAYCYNLRHLLMLARLKCVTSFNELLQKSDFVVLSAPLLETLLRRGDLLVYEEEEVFELVMAWCQHSPDTRRDFLPQLLQHVKLPLLDQKYFVHQVEVHPLIKNNPLVFDLLMEARRYHSTGNVNEGPRIVPRQNATMHQVFVTVGGCDENDRFIGEVSVLDFQHKTRATLCNLPSNRNSTRFVADGGHQINPIKLKWAEFGCVAWKNNIVISGGKESRKEAWMFVTRLRQWVELGNLNTGRWRHRMVCCKGVLYVVGGYDGLLRVDSLEKYDTRENKWVEKRHMREGVSSAAVCECNELIYVFGGGPSVRVSSEKVQAYDPVTDSWRFSTSMPEPAKCINAVAYQGCAYVVGGTLRSILRFDAKTEVWEKVGEPLQAERASCGVTLCNDKIFIVGGRNESGKVIANVSYLDAETNNIRSECNIPIGISHHGCITLHKHDSIRSKML